LQILPVMIIKCFKILNMTEITEEYQLAFSGYNTEALFKTVNLYEQFALACRRNNIELINVIWNDPEFDKSINDKFMYIFGKCCEIGAIDIVKLLWKLSNNKIIISGNFKPFILSCSRGHLNIME